MSREDLLTLALDTTGITKKRWDLLAEAFKDDAEMNRIMREEWHSKPRDSEQRIREYYRDSDIWFLNTFNHGFEALLHLANAGGPTTLEPWQRILVEDFKITGPILDYGGGLFKDSWPLVLSGYEVALAEVRGPVTAFLMRYLEMIAPSIRTLLRVVEVDEDLPIHGMYHAAISFETLEHLLNPLEFVQHLREHLAPGAPFAFSVSFGDVPHAPYHVAKNAGLGRDDLWGIKLQELGFRPHWKGLNHFQIWRRV